MATTLNNVNEDLLFYQELKKYVWPRISEDKNKHNIWLVKNGLLQIETLLELAISKKGKIKIEHVWGRDFEDGSDAKKVTSVFRMNHKEKGMWLNSYMVRNYKTKTGALRVMAYNRYAKKFDYYVIPNHSFQHLTGPAIEIVLDSFCGKYTKPTPTGESANCHWNAYKVKDFLEMARKKC